MLSEIELFFWNTNELFVFAYLMMIITAEGQRDTHVFAWLRKNRSRKQRVEMDIKKLHDDVKARINLRVRINLSFIYIYFIYILGVFPSLWIIDGRECYLAILSAESS